MPLRGWASPNPPDGGPIACRQSKTLRVLLIDNAALTRVGRSSQPSFGQLSVAFSNGLGFAQPGLTPIAFGDYREEAPLRGAVPNGTSSLRLLAILTDRRSVGSPIGGIQGGARPPLVGEADPQTGNKIFPVCDGLTSEPCFARRGGKAFGLAAVGSYAFGITADGAQLASLIELRSIS